MLHCRGVEVSRHENLAAIRDQALKTSNSVHVKHEFSAFAITPGEHIFSCNVEHFENGEFSMSFHHVESHFGVKFGLV